MYSSRYWSRVVSCGVQDGCHLLNTDTELDSGRIESVKGRAYRDPRGGESL